MKIGAIQNNSIQQMMNVSEINKVPPSQAATDMDKMDTPSPNQLPHDEYISSKRLSEKDKKSEECTTNTDKVDREIEALKQKKERLEQQIRSASGNENKIKELEKKLSAIENELKQKDNDTYRRQNAVVS